MPCAYVSDTEAPLAISISPRSPICPKGAKPSQRLTRVCLFCRVVGTVSPHRGVLLCQIVITPTAGRAHGWQRIVVTGFIIIFSITITTAAVTTPFIPTVTTTIWSQQTQRCLSQGQGATPGLGGRAGSCPGQSRWYSCSEQRPGGHRRLVCASGKWSPVLVGK